MFKFHSFSIKILFPLTLTSRAYPLCFCASYLNGNFAVRVCILQSMSETKNTEEKKKKFVVSKTNWSSTQEQTGGGTETGLNTPHRPFPLQHRSHNTRTHAHTHDTGLYPHVHETNTLHTELASTAHEDTGLQHTRLPSTHNRQMVKKTHVGGIRNTW